MTPPEPAVAHPTRAGGIFIALGGLSLSIGFILFAVLFSPSIADDALRTLLQYLAVWVPLVLAIALARVGRPRGSFVADIGLRFRPIDVLWGLAVGLLVRSVAAAMDLLFYGTTGSSAAILGAPTHDLWWVFIAILVPVIFAPFVEELFFRGLLLGAFLRYSKLWAVGTSSILFALVHLMQVTSVLQALDVGVTTIVLGAVLATLTVMTGRLGGAIVGHVAFNALVVLPAMF